MIRRFMSVAMMFAAMVFAFQPALAKPPQNVRSGSKTSVNRPAPKASPAKAQNRNVSANNNRSNTNYNQSNNNNNRPNNNNNRNPNYKKGGNNNIGNTVVVAPNRPPPPRGGNYYGGGGSYYGNNDNWDNDDNDFAEFVGKTIAVTAGAAIVGSILTDKPSNKDGSECEQTISNGQVYMNCNGTWFQPVQSGSNVNYQTVNPPR